MPTTYGAKLAKLAEDEFDAFNGYHETHPKLAKRIKQYWVDLGLEFTSTGTPWSAVFVSFFVKTAGATSTEFRFSARHSIFVYDAIKNADDQQGVFRAYSPELYSPKIGDIIQNNRNGNAFDYEYAKNNLQYESHSAIVVEEGLDGKGRYVRTIGGNEGNTVGERIVRLDSNGKIVRPASDPTHYISIIQNLK